jgi:hypothetical protein
MRAHIPRSRIIVGVGSGNPGAGNNNGTLKGVREVHSKSLSQYNLDFEETPIDIPIFEIDKVHVSILEKIPLGYFVGWVPPKLIIRRWVRED